MKLRYILLLTILLTAGFSGKAMVSSGDGSSVTATEIKTPSDDIIIHTVISKETVYSIAAAYHISVQEIYRLNPNAKNGIKVGEKLQIPLPKAVTGYSNHVIEAKETLHSVARMYHISVDDIKNANTALDESTFRIGRTIRIPKFEISNYSIPASGNLKSSTEYLVKKGDTLYSIGRVYNVSVEALMAANPQLSEGGLKDGTTIIIPGKQDVISSNVTEKQALAPLQETPYATKGETVRIGILMPFLDDKGSITKEKLVEYYDGFLLALKKMKENGLNAEVYTFDIGPEKNTKKLESLLGTNEMKNLHLIIGGISKQQIDALSKFSKKTGIKYVIPFGSTDEIKSNPSLYQLNSSHSSLYSEIIEAFKRQYRDYNIVFVSESGSNNDKVDFVNALKKDLSKSNFPYKTTAGTSNLLEDIKGNLNTYGKNVLIPTSSSEATLKKVITAIGGLTTEQVTLFGYPEWQIYSHHATALHKYNSCFYSIFFANEKAKDVMEFSAEYKNWYGKELVNSFPRYGYLGYDTGLYFLTALNRYGSEFESKMSEFKVPTLQSAVHFKEVNENGGFINNGIYFIHYKQGSEIEKTDVSN